MRHNTIQLLFILLLAFGCTAKKYALLCPGEKSHHSTLKPAKVKQHVSLKSRVEKIASAKKESKELPPPPITQDTSDDLDKSVPKQGIAPSVSKKKNTKRKAIFEDDEEEDKKTVETHRPSIWAFNLFFSFSYLSIFGIVPMFVGLIWAIRNLFFLRSRKDEYSWKGLSLLVVFSFIGMCLLATLILATQWVYIGMAFDVIEIAAIMFFAILFFISVIALVFYYTEQPFYSQSE